jgi:hypothetical protein
MQSLLFQVNQQKYFASTDGSYIDQDIHRLWMPFFATAVDQKENKFRTRQGLSAPVGMGYEYLDARPEHKLQAAGGVTTLYTKSYDLIEDARLAGKQAKAKLTAKSVEPGKYDLVLTPEHLWLTIHESVGHPTELDRVLGYEANYAGTSFATLDKWQRRPSSTVRSWSTSSPTRPRQVRWARSATTMKASSASAGTSSRTASWSTTRPRATRPTSSAKKNRTAARMRTTGPTCSSSACLTSRSRQARRS